MGHQRLLDELQAAGYSPRLAQGSGGKYVVFGYVVPVGAHAGEEVQVALQSPDWPLNPPGGPNISPRIPHPADDANHVSPLLGGDAIYWSRPYPGWGTTERSLPEYLTHLRALFAQFAEPVA